MGSGRAWLYGVLAALAAAVVVWLYAPAADLEFMSDDYQWWQHARRARHHPWQLLADLGGFYRPLGTWTMVADELLWGRTPAGYRATNLLLHLLAAALFGVATWRLGLPPPAGLAVASLWAVSPWAAESAMHVALRVESVLMAAWAVVLAAWPRQGEGWSSARRAAVGAAIAAAALSKETWVVTPGLVLLLEVAHRRRRGLQALMPAAVVAAVALLYATLHAALLSLGRRYFVWDWSVLARLPQQVGAFLLLETPQVAEFRLTAGGVVGAVALGAVAWGAWRSRSAGLAIGLGLLVLPALPTLGTPVLALRYAAVSYGGFLVIVATLCEALRRRVPGRWRSPLAAALVGGVLALGGWSVGRVRLELEDARRISLEHARLLQRLRAVVPAFPIGVPVVVVSAPEASPLAAVVASPAGWPKAIFIRGDDPGGLADSAALLEWVLQPRGLQVDHVADWRGPQGRRPGVVLRYSHAEGFRWLRDGVDDAGRWATHWRSQGFGVRLVVARPRAGGLS